MMRSSKNERENILTANQEGASEEYAQFLEKFKPKRTTDDCYTPDNIYDVVATYVRNRYGEAPFVRPFYPGGDFESFAYPEGCIVVDNPPFSILHKIITYYQEHEIRFFLFCPSLTSIGSTNVKGVTAICVGANIMYANGTEVPTSFVTNMEPDIVAMACPWLYDNIKAANAENVPKIRGQLPKYAYPSNVLTAAAINRLSKYGTEFSVPTDESTFIRKLDAQAEAGKAVYGAGLLVSDSVASDFEKADISADTVKMRTEADKIRDDAAKVKKWQLSAREREIIAGLAINHMTGG